MFYRTPSLVLSLAAAIVAPGLADATSTLTGDLARRADLGFRTEVSGARLEVSDLDPESPAARAGLEEGASLLAVGGTEIADPRHGAELLRRRGDGGHPLSLRFATPRGVERSVSFTPQPLPLEEVAGVDTTYGVVDLPDGTRLRTLVSRPQGATGPLPAIFFTQWVSCGSIEFRAGGSSRGTLATLARESGMVLLRVERSSDGDSEGPACHELDYDTELAHYRAAFDRLVESPWVDRDRVVILGSSLGSTTAPLLAESVLAGGGRIAGVAVQGGGAVTYAERMITFDRFNLERRPEAVAPQEIHSLMLDRIAFQTEYLIRGRHPDEIAGDSERMAAVRASILGLGEDEQYGRPFTWHQQAARRNFLAAWAAIDAPVLVVFNQLDQYEGRHGHRLIVDMVNRLRPGTATWVEHSNVDHSNYLFPTPEAAYADVGGIAVPELLTHAILSWLRTIGLV